MKTHHCKEMPRLSKRDIRDIYLILIQAAENNCYCSTEECHYSKSCKYYADIKNDCILAERFKAFCGQRLSEGGGKC